MFQRKRFHGGVHPHDEKKWSERKAIEICPPPEKVIIPLLQHIGAPPEILVEKGDEVLLGQQIAKADKFVSVPVHASVSGKVLTVEPHPHPFGVNILSVTIENNGEDKKVDTIAEDKDYAGLDAEAMKRRIQEAGLAGMGGAAFPTHVKLSPPSDKGIDTVILNGVECEPYLTADHRLMLERTDEIIKGLEIILKILNARTAIIGIEKNKPDAIKVMQKKIAKRKDWSVLPLAVKYPQGAEKQLIVAATGRTVPAGSLPMDVGCLVHNVGTAVAIFEAVSLHKPLYERVVTVTGPGIKDPKNCLVRIGTPFEHLIAFCGGLTDNAAKVINGGPMMGIAQTSTEVPVIKGTSGILVLDRKMAGIRRERPCIACARCVDICPMKLLPSTIANLIAYGREEQAKETGMLDCIECGSCGFICPAKRNLVHYVKLGKASWAEKQRKTG